MEFLKKHKSNCSNLIKYFALIFFLFLNWNREASAIDIEVTRITIKDVPGVYVIIEDLNQNFMKYEKYITKVGLTKVLLQKEIEWKLKSSGIKVLTKEEWMKVLGRPALCLTINTHESEKYWLAYDIRVEVRQIVLLQINPKIMNWSSTWSTNITGIANIGNLQLIKHDAFVMVEKFIQAYKSVNLNK